jgi:hypothetical protein
MLSIKKKNLSLLNLNNWLNNQNTINSALIKEVYSLWFFQGVCLIGFLPHIYDSSADERNAYIKIMTDVRQIINK